MSQLWDLISYHKWLRSFTYSTQKPALLILKTLDRFHRTWQHKWAEIWFDKKKIHSNIQHWKQHKESSFIYMLTKNNCSEGLQRRACRPWWPTTVEYWLKGVITLQRKVSPGCITKRTGFVFRTTTMLRVRDQELFNMCILVCCDYSSASTSKHVWRSNAHPV